MSTPTKSEYMLLFRGTDWHKGLSPQEIQQVVNQMKAWFDRLTAKARPRPGNHCSTKAKLFHRKEAARCQTVRLPNLKKLLVASFYLRSEAGRGRRDCQGLSSLGVRRYGGGQACCA